MLSAEIYFKKFLAYEMGTISNSNLTPHDVYYESYRSLDSTLLKFHAENEHNPGAMEELGERAIFEENDPAGAVRYLKDASAMGNGEASALLAQIFRSPSSGYADMDLYFQFLQLSAQQGCSLGMFNLSCAYFKGKTAYNGHGFDENKEMAFKWSSEAAKRAMGFFEILMTTRCTKAFTDFMQQQFELIVKCTCVSAEQLIDGNGIRKDLAEAKRMLNEAQSFCVKYIGQKVPDFEKLLNEIG